MFTDKPSLLLISGPIEPNLPPNDTNVLDALYEFMHSGKDPNAVDELIVNFVDHLKLSYGDRTATSEPKSFEHYLEVGRFRFNDESTDNLVKLIRHFDSVGNNNSRDQGEKFTVITSKNFTIEVNRVYFYVKLGKMIDDMFQFVEDYDINADKESYIRLLAICDESPQMFQHFYKMTAKKMIEWKFPRNIQVYLKQFIFDIRLRKTNYADFNRMYGKDLLMFVKLISEALYGTDDEDSSETNASSNPIVCDILRNLRLKDFQRFVILITHFEQFRYLLDESNPFENAV